MIYNEICGKCGGDMFSLMSPLTYAMNSMSLHNRSFFKLNFMNTFIMEWAELYVSLDMFVHDVFNHHYNQLIWFSQLKASNNTIENVLVQC